MPNPNIVPRPENLTRAGMGQPPKGYQQRKVSLPPEIWTAIDQIAEQQGWKKNYTMIQILKSKLGQPCDYDQDIDAIICGAPID